MRARSPVSQRIHLAGRGAGGIVAGEAELTAGTVLGQEVQADEVLCLDMRIMAGGALHIARDQMDRAGWIRVLWVVVSEAARSMLFLSGVTRLNGWEVCKLVPKTSAVYIDPFMVTWP